MTNETSTLPLAERHYLTAAMTRTACGLTHHQWTMNGLGPDNRADVWADVTCGSCRLEQPEDMTGRPEYRVPADVKARDRALGAQDAHQVMHSMCTVDDPCGDRACELETVSLLLAAVNATYATLGESIEYLKERRGEARAERESLIRRLSALRSAETVPGVPVSGAGEGAPAQTLSTDRMRYRVLEPGWRAGDVGTFTRLTGKSDIITIRFDDGEERTYHRRYLQRIS